MPQVKPDPRAYSFVFTFAFVRDGCLQRRVHSFRGNGDFVVCEVDGLEGEFPLEGDFIRVGEHRLLLEQELRTSSGLAARERRRGREAPPPGEEAGVAGGPRRPRGKTRL